MEDTPDLQNEDNPQEGNEESADSKLTRRTKLKLFVCIHWRGLVCVITPLILIPILAPFPPKKYQWCAYTLLLMSIYWMTECIPLHITSFIPVAIFPLTGVMDTRATCKCYMHTTIFMFYGSMVLAYAVETSGLHQRLVLFAIRRIGYSHYRILFAMTTMFVSMWITNIATITMMIPINFALLRVFQEQNLLEIYELDANGQMIAFDITTCYFCTTSFSATIGGVGTLVGTATNLAFKGLFQKYFPTAPEYLTFPKFSAFSIPYMLVMEMCLYFSMIIGYLGYLRPNSKAAKRANIPEAGKLAAKNALEENWLALGKITFWEIMVVILFSFAMLLFLCRSPHIFKGWGDRVAIYYGLNDKKFVRDSAAALLVAFLLMLLPSTLDIFKNCSAKVTKLPDKPVPTLIDWGLINDVMPYSFMCLLGGGIAISEAAKKEYSDLNGQVRKILKNLTFLPNSLVMMLMIIFTVFVTNFASNIAVCNIIAPIAMRLAKEIDFHPLWFNITAGFSASLCFCSPVGSPGNSMIQSAANIPTVKMIKAGIVPSIMTIILTWISIYFWAPIIWPEFQSTSHIWLQATYDKE